MSVFRLSDALIFPPPQLADSEGLLAVGGDLSVERLKLAYSMGIFPWFNDGDPILWWSPDPRLLMPLDGFYISSRLARTIRQGRFLCTFDENFDAVIECCATVRGPRRDGTWITDAMQEAYINLHRAGFAHSVEVWLENRLVGGMYGVAIGSAFFGESMFSLESNASKIAFAALMERLNAWGFTIMDCQMPTPHLLRLGGRVVRRERFLAKLEKALNKPTRRHSWTDGTAN
ncbi:MAG: leucyl/phenylalanyl-tRNA--protein transferase [Candidatus Hydrogenedentes bacterium]|nr:leucyl/phenylalanyl-tRNA--protein transferase [Candidatus Hydrogenedentota bacterium]